MYFNGILQCTHTHYVMPTQSVSAFPVLYIGTSVQTEIILRQAITDCIEPAVFLDKMEQALIELQLRREDLYQTLHRIVESFNTVIVTYTDDAGPIGPVMVGKRNREREREREREKEKERNRDRERETGRGREKEKWKVGGQGNLHVLICEHLWQPKCLYYPYFIG